jgi:hypothetical protein
MPFQKGNNGGHSHRPTHSWCEHFCSTVSQVVMQALPQLLYIKPPKHIGFIVGSMVGDPLGGAEGAIVGRKLGCLVGDRVGEEVSHLPIAQAFERQSEPKRHCSPTTQAGQFCPPQSTSVSS